MGNYASQISNYSFVQLHKNNNKTLKMSLPCELQLVFCQSIWLVLTGRFNLAKSYLKQRKQTLKLKCKMTLK
jgi:hypothetical protein